MKKATGYQEHPCATAKYITGKNGDADDFPCRAPHCFTAPPVSFNTRCGDGIQQGPVTSVGFMWSDTALFVHAKVSNPGFKCRYCRGELWHGSNVELLLSPNRVPEPCMDEYELLFCPDNVSVSLQWRGKGLADAIARPLKSVEYQSTAEDAAGNWSFTAAIGFASFDAPPPCPGTRWGMGIFRKIVPESGSDILLAWSPTLEEPPRFHRPEKFGILEFNT